MHDVIEQEQMLADIAVSATISGCAEASAWLAGAEDSLQLPAKQITRLDHCLDEVLANILTHGGPDASAASIFLELQVGQNEGISWATLTVRDHGIPFNPLEVSVRPIARHLDDVHPGGLGLLMIRKNSDRLDYRYENGQNHLMITVHWQAATS